MADEQLNYNLFDNKNVLIHSGDSAEFSPGIYLNDTAAVMYAPAGTSSILLSDDGGISLMGSLAIQAMPEQVRFAGLWKINPLVITSLPSTLYTPIPWLKQSPPEPSKAISEGIALAISTINQGIGLGL